MKSPFTLAHGEIIAAGTPTESQAVTSAGMAHEQGAMQGVPPLAAGSPAATEEAAALAICHRLRDGAARMTRQQFRNCLKRSIGADKGYADNCRRHFQDNPAAYLASRTPQTQSIELLRVIFRITRQENT